MVIFSVKQLYDMYKVYCEESREQYPLKKRVFRADMKTYFDEFYDVTRLEDGRQARSVYRGFKSYMFSNASEIKDDVGGWIKLGNNESIFDKMYGDIQAQYPNDAGIPKYSWKKCKTKLKDIDTSNYIILGASKRIIL